MEMILKLLSALGFQVESVPYEEVLSLVLNQHVDQIACEWHEDPSLFD